MERRSFLALLAGLVLPWKGKTAELPLGDWVVEYVAPFDCSGDVIDQGVVRCPLCGTTASKIAYCGGCVECLCDSDTFHRRCKSCSHEWLSRTAL